MQREKLTLSVLDCVGIAIFAQFALAFLVAIWFGFTETSLRVLWTQIVLIGCTMLAHHAMEARQQRTGRSW
jgi:hypothetical protein